MTVANDNAELPAVPDKQLLFDLPRESYDSLKSELNWSRMKELGKSAAHFKYAVETPHESTDTQERGIAGHVATLEPTKYGGKAYDALDKPDGTLFSVWPAKNGKRGTNAWDAAETTCRRRRQILIREADHNWCVAISAAVHASKPAAPYLVGRTEVTMRWKQRAGAMGGRPPFTWNLRGRVDKMAMKGDQPFCLVDFKSTVDSSENGFMKQVALYGYGAQGAFYLDGYKELTGVELPYAFVAAEAEPPHVVTVFEFPFDDEIFQLGREIYKHHLELFRRCTESGEWPGYARGVVRGARLPKWARPFEGNELEPGDETTGGPTPFISF